MKKKIEIINEQEFENIMKQILTIDSLKSALSKYFNANQIKEFWFKKLKRFLQEDYKYKENKETYDELLEKHLDALVHYNSKFSGKLERTLKLLFHPDKKDNQIVDKKNHSNFFSFINDFFKKIKDQSLDEIDIYTPEGKFAIKKKYLAEFKNNLVNNSEKEILSLFESYLDFDNGKITDEEFKEKRNTLQENNKDAFAIYRKITDIVTGEISFLKDLHEAEYKKKEYEIKKSSVAKEEIKFVIEIFNNNFLAELPNLEKRYSLQTWMITEIIAAFKEFYTKEENFYLNKDYVKNLLLCFMLNHKFLLPLSSFKENPYIHFENYTTLKSMYVTELFKNLKTIIDESIKEIQRLEKNKQEAAENEAKEKKKKKLDQEVKEKITQQQEAAELREKNLMGKEDQLSRKIEDQEFEKKKQEAAENEAKEKEKLIREETNRVMQEQERERVIRQDIARKGIERDLMEKEDQLSRKIQDQEKELEDKKSQTVKEELLSILFGEKIDINKDKTKILDSLGKQDHESLVSAINWQNFTSGSKGFGILGIGSLGYAGINTLRNISNKKLKIGIGLVLGVGSLGLGFKKYHENNKKIKAKIKSFEVSHPEYKGMTVGAFKKMLVPDNITKNIK